MVDTKNGNSEDIDDSKKDSSNWNNQKFIDNFIKTQKKDGKSEKEFLDSLFDENASWNVKKDLEQFLKEWEDTDQLLSKSDYKWININEALLDLKQKKLKDYVPLKNKRQRLENTLALDYELSSENKKKLESWIKDLEIKDLDLLLNEVINNQDISKWWDSDIFDTLNKAFIKRNSFLEKIFWKKLPNKKERETFVNNFNLSWLSEEEILKLFEKEPNVLQSLKFLNFRDKTEKLTTTDVWYFIDLIKSNYLSENTKRKIIIDYVPYFSFPDAKKLGIISLTDIEAKKEILRKANISDLKIDKLTNNEINDFISNEELRKTTFSTKDLLIVNNINSLLNSENFLNFFANKYTIDQNKKLNEFFEWLEWNIDWFRTNLNKLDNVEWWLNFQNGSYLVIKKEISASFMKEDEEWKKKKWIKSSETVSYIKIISDWTENGIIKYYDLWTWEILLHNTREEKSTYGSFLNFIEKWNKDQWVEKILKCEILDKKEIDKRIASSDIIQWLDLDLVEEFELDKIIAEKEKELSELKEKKEKEYEKQWFTWKELKKKVNEDSEIVDLQSEIKETQAVNLNFLIDELKKIDTNFKYDFKVWTTFSTNKSNGESFFTIKHLDEISNWWKIIISDIFWTIYPDFTFIEFLKIFDEQQWFLTSDIQSFGDIFDKISLEDENVKSGWNKFKFDGTTWRILKKSTNNEDDDKQTNIEYDFLVSDEWEELLKIHSISWWIVKVSPWEYKETKNDKEKDDKIKTFWVSDKIYTMTIWELYSRISKYKLKPRALGEEKDVKEDQAKNNDIKWSFWTRYFKRMSIKDLLAWWKLWIESIESYLKQSEEENAAKFANSVFGWILPKEISNDLLTRVEWAQKKRQDDYIQQLKDVDSGPATRMIIWWLENSDSPEYKKEAWMIFMLEKYGVLYAKDLTEFKWTFLWYEAMWWKVWDELYLKIKKQAEEEDDMPFTEEQLLFSLIGKQCKWELKPKRRSRLHKDYNRFRNLWKEEEFKTWEQDASNKRNVEWRVEYVFWEMKSWTYPNARGWYKKVISKWGPMHVMNEVPFVMLFSWVAYWYEQDELDKWKSLIAEWEIMAITQFLWHTSDMELFNNTVLQVCSIIQEEWGKYSKIYDEAKAVFWKQRSVEWDKDKINRGREFYKKYWEVLTNSLNMLNIKDTWEDSKYADLIVTHKDKVWDREWNSALREYYNRFHSWDDFNFENEDLMTDPFHSAWTTWMDMKKAVVDTLGLMTWATLRKKRTAPMLWREITNSFHAIWTKTYFSEDDRKVKMKHELRGLIAWFIENNGWSDYITSYNNPSFLFSKLNDWWVYLKEVAENNVNLEWIEKWHKNAEKLLDRWVEQIIDFEQTWNSYKDSWKEDVKRIKDEIPSITDDTKWDTYEILNVDNYLPNDFNKSA